MKYIKAFENIYSDYLKVDDIVILIKDSSDSKKFNYRIGDICRIITVDKSDYILPYEVKNLTNSDVEYEIWVEYDQIRLAEDWDLDQNKYNL